MYGSADLGEKYELYTFAKPGATVESILDTYAMELSKYSSPNDKTIAVISVGMNNAKAISEPDNFASTTSDYLNNISLLLANVAKQVDHVVCVGFMPVDEALTAPKTTSLSRTKPSYFFNERIKEFNNAFKSAAEQTAENISFINLYDRIALADWTKHYLYTDGLHPNSDGHQWIKEQVLPELELLTLER